MIVTTMQKSLYISLSRTNLSTQFIPEEVGIYFPEDGTLRVIVFNKPPDLMLTADDIQTDWYTRSVLGGIGLHQPLPGELHHWQLVQLLHTLASQYRFVCNGQISANYLSSILPFSEVRNINLTYLRTLQQAQCGMSHNGRFCALAKQSGTNLSSRFVPKEVALYFPDDGTWRVMVFNTPPELMLTAEDLQTDWYTRSVLGGIGLDQPLPGALYHRQLVQLLHTLAAEYRFICNGNITAD